MSLRSCRACGGTDLGRTHVASEQSFGLGGAYVYAECGDCGSLSLVDVPDLAPFYSNEYYALATPRAPLARALGRVREYRQSAALLATARALGLAVDARTRVLDVGAGNGIMLRGLARRGWRHLVGYDPFLAEDVAEPVRLTRRAPDPARERYDVVTFNHALEHVPDPLADLVAALAMLEPQRGAAIVRVPIAAYAWRRYGVHWFGLEAPRHLMVPTERGVRALVARAGGVIAAMRYDSGGAQFWASRLYRRGRTLQAATGTPLRSIASYGFGALRYGRAARRLNRAGDGDAAAFLIRPGAA